ncbi:heme exporter protein CcmB [Lichenihabitans sp. Uapishka_5]|uniref:heme exporter protein CcmB n=1 Tax=Lichenihabitans sp. Uapishka_5 TaxID=3037302 RepID=UPI0029E7FF7A|nr:heme exporter protein CcmB [Lichenihabitans sp. Uapishka_5]MDX7950980.1 heme exporter protein CcmB [Lichenihabitans sp. Uapishka_5]
MRGALWALFRREVAVARRLGGGGLTGVSFMLALVIVVPFAVGPDLNLLRRIGPAMLWIAALLATLLGLDRLFQADLEDGSLDALRLGGVPLELVVVVKCAAHWCTTGLPLLLVTPVFGLLFALDGAALAGVAASLAVGTPALTLVGAIGAALTAGFRRGGLLLAVLTVPLAIPVLIFGVAAAGAASPGAIVPFLMPFLVLCGLSLLALAGAPFAAAAALRLMGE